MESGFLLPLPKGLIDQQGWEAESDHWRALWQNKISQLETLWRRCQTTVISSHFCPFVRLCLAACLAPTGHGCSFSLVAWTPLSEHSVPLMNLLHLSVLGFPRRSDPTRTSLPRFSFSWLSVGSADSVWVQPTWGNGKRHRRMRSRTCWNISLLLSLPQKVSGKQLTLQLRPHIVWPGKLKVVAVGARWLPAPWIW